MSKASLVYWFVAAPTNTMFTGQEVQEVKGRTRVPVVPGVQFATGDNWVLCLAGTYSADGSVQLQAETWLAYGQRISLGHKQKHSQ